MIWKRVAGRTLTPEVARQLIEEGKTREVLSGFRSRSGKPFRARLVLNDEGKIEFEFPARARIQGARRDGITQGTALVLRFEGPSGRAGSPGNDQEIRPTVRKFDDRVILQSRTPQRNERTQKLSCTNRFRLLETEARTLVEGAEERGYLEAAELEAFALEHDLDDADVEELTRELERIGLEIARAARTQKRREAGRAETPDPDVARRAPPTAFSSSWPTSAATSC